MARSTPSAVVGRQRRLRLPPVAALFVGTTVALALRCLCQRSFPTRAWLLPPSSASQSSSDLAVPLEEPLGPQLGRRHAWQESAAAGAVALWATSPEAAHAFRADRLMNAKRRYVPKIRAYYQQLEGLRDDLYLEVELQEGNATRRVGYEARVAEWYDGLDSKLDGRVVMPLGDGLDVKTGCQPFTLPEGGGPAVVLLARGKCPFETKMANALAAGAKSVIVYDERISSEDANMQSRTGAVPSKGIATRVAGDALTGAGTSPKAQGVTIMGVAPGGEKPKLDGVMISLTNGTELQDAVAQGLKPRVLDVKRFKFQAGIDRFIKKDLPKLLGEMEIYSNVMRVSKDDMSDPIIVKLKGDRKAFEKAVRAKDYAEIRRTFQAWNDHLDALGKWELVEIG